MFKYRDEETAKKILKGIADMGVKAKFMHICGTHQDTIVRFGLEEMLRDAGVEIAQGPGCPVCVTTSREVADAITLARNGVTSVVPTVGDANEYPGRAGGYDLVCANILGHLLRAFKVRIASWVKPGRYLCLAGILNEEFDALAADYRALGFEEVDRVTLKEWTSGLFRKRL